MLSHVQVITEVESTKRVPAVVRAGASDICSGSALK